MIDAVNGFMRQIHILNNLIDETLPTTTDSKFTRTRKAIASLRVDKQVHAIEQTLSSYKSLLTLKFASRSIYTSKSISESDGKITYNVPPRQVSCFIGRKTLLADIDQHLGSRKSNSTRRIVILQGMGGQGKTQAALHYGQISVTNSTFGKVVWIDASSPASALRSFDSIYALMSLTKSQAEDQVAKRAAVLKEASGWTLPWLMIFDNYNTPAAFNDIAENFPSGVHCAILFTSRHAQAGRLGQCIEVTGMSVEDSNELFLYRCGCETTPRTVNEATHIVTRLGFLPLAIDQAAAYVKARRLPLNGFLDHFNNRMQNILAHTPAQWEYRRKLSEEQVETSLSVFTTWEMNFSQISDDDIHRDSIEKFLTIVSFLDTSTISEMLFQTAFGFEMVGIGIFDIDGNWEPFKFQDVVAQLSELSLIQNFSTSGSQSRFRLHPLVADWLRLRHSLEKQWTFLKSVTNLVAKHIDLDTWRDQTYNTQRELESYVDDCVRHDNRYHQLAHEYELDILGTESLAFFYSQAQRGHDSKILYRRCLERLETSPQLNDFDTPRVLTGLSLVYLQECALTRAQELLDRAVAMWEHLALTDPTILESHNALQTIGTVGAILAQSGNSSAAQKAFRWCLAGYEKHKSTSRQPQYRHFACHLGIWLSNTSRIREAEIILKENKDAYDKAGQAKTGGALKNMGALGKLFLVKGRYRDARDILEYTLTGQRDLYGTEDLRTILTFGALGSVFVRLKEYDRAETVLEECLDFYQDKYPGMETNVAIRENFFYVQYWLGELYYTQGRTSEAMVRLEYILHQDHQMSPFMNPSVGYPAIGVLGTLLDIYIT